MILSKVGSKITPFIAAAKWKFTLDGLLIWQTDFGALKFAKRIKSYDEKTLRDWLASGGYAIVEVDGFHWLAVDRFGLMGLYCVDPLGGKSVRPLKKYHKITGVALFSKQ